MSTDTLSGPLTASSRPNSAENSRRPSSDTAIDDDLVRRFIAGDEDAFVDIVSRHTTKIFAVVLGILRNHADTEEITQDTFLRAHRGLSKFRGDSSLGTWLYRIAVNLARNRYWYYIRRRRPDSLSLDRPLGEEGTATFADLIADRSHDPVQETIANEFSTSVADGMARLEAPHREILVLCNVLHHSYDEIAATLGVKVGTVKSRIARARGNLRELLAETCPELAADSNLGGWFQPSRVMYGRPEIAGS